MIEAIIIIMSNNLHLFIMFYNNYDTEYLPFICSNLVLGSHNKSFCEHNICVLCICIYKDTHIQ